IPVLAVWAVMSRRGRLLPALFLGAVPLALLIAFPWHYHMYLKHGHAFIQQYIFHEVVGRAQGENGRAPFYYYAIQLTSTYWPWLIGLAWALYVRFQPGKPARPPA